MSSHYHAGQFERSFNLLNSHASNRRPTVKVSGSALDKRAGSPDGPRSPTQFVVDDRGHPLPGIKKTGSAFNHVAIGTGKAPRWPKTNALIPLAPGATMGYKGIPSTYLPTNTVMMQTSCTISNTK
jgi:hypothetical protein